MKKRLIGAVIAIIVLVLVVSALFIFNKPKKVLLSFDVETVDNVNTLILLTSMLEKNNAKATFFVTGQFAERNPEFMLYLDKNSHEIGCHTYSHAMMTKLSDEEKEKNIDRCITSISKIIGRDPVGFRAPNHEIDQKTFELLEKFGFSYDASLVSGFTFMTPKPTITEIMLSTFIFFPLEDYIYIYTLKMPSMFFWIVKAYRGDHVSLLMHPRYISGHIDELGSVIEYFKKTGAVFMSYEEFFKQTSKAAS